MSDNINQNPSRLGQIKRKRGNPYRDDRALFLGPKTAEQKARQELADQWDRDHPEGVEDGGGIA